MVDTTERVSVLLETYVEHDEDDPLAGGYVKIRCGCGFSGYVDVDDNGSAISGGCEECYAQFTMRML